MKITKFRELDEAVARALGYRYFNESYNLKPYDCGWIPPEITEEKEKEWLNYNDGGLPEFSTDYRAMRKIIDFFKEENLVVEMTTHSDVTIVQVKERPHWKSFDSDYYPLFKVCGKGTISTDCPINSLPIALCLCLLEYKKVEFKLDLPKEDE